MTNRVPHLPVKRNLKKRHERKILKLVSFTSLASPAATATSVQPACPGPIHLSPVRTDVLGLTGLMCWWCRCEETTSAGRLPATAPLLRDNRSTDLHTFAAISVVKPRREGDCCGRTETHRREEGGWWAGLRGRTTASYTCPVLHQYAKDFFFKNTFCLANS